MAYPGAMEEASLDQAMARIGSAVARLERALDDALLSRQPAVDPALAARHERLRRRVGGALEEIDRLIGTLER
jgi:hypothetical protein